MEDQKPALLKIVSAGQCGAPDDEGKRYSDFFIIVGQNRKTRSYTVWVYPDRTRAFNQLGRLRNVISEEQYDQTHQLIKLSQLPDFDLTKKSLVLKGLAAQLYAKLVNECAELNDQLVRAKRPSDHFSTSDLPS